MAPLDLAEDGFALLQAVDAADGEAPLGELLPGWERPRSWLPPGSC